MEKIQDYIEVILTNSIIFLRILGTFFFSFFILHAPAIFKIADISQDADANGDNIITISDIKLNIIEIFFASGDVYLSWLSTTSIGQFLELNQTNPDSLFLSLVLWLLILIIFLSTIQDFKSCAWKNITNIND